MVPVLLLMVELLAPVARDVTSAETASVSHWSGSGERAGLRQAQKSEVASIPRTGRLAALQFVPGRPGPGSHEADEVKWLIHGVGRNLAYDLDRDQPTERPARRGSRNGAGGATPHHRRADRHGRGRRSRRGHGGARQGSI